MHWHLMIDPATHLERNVFKERNLTERAGRAFARQLVQVLDIDAALKAFGQEMDKVRPGADARDCWKILDTGDPDRRAELFGLGLLTLSQLWLEQAAEELAEPDDDPIDPETFLEDLDEDLPYCLGHQARNQLAQALTRPFHLWKQDETARNWCAEALLAVLVETLRKPLNLETEDISGQNTNGHHRTYKLIRLGAQDTTDRLRELLRTFPYRLTVQPLTRPPSYRKPDGDIPPDWEDYGPLVRRRGGYNTFLRRWDRELPPDDAYVQGVECLQRTRWRLNPALAANLLRWVDAEDPPIPLTDDEHRWLSSPMFRRLSETGSIVFYLPWRADYRGRVYPRTPYFNFQGGDLQRALFEFANGVPLNEAGVSALKRHGGNLVKRERLLEDLRIGDRRVVTLEERTRWVEAHDEQIRALARNPLAHKPWWLEVTDAPWQFLAFALAWDQYRTDPQTPIHLPVEIDGSCNGLQHIAALTGDQALARAVNVLPHEDGRPGDIYTEIATEARRHLQDVLRKKIPKRGTKDFLTDAQALLNDLLPKDCFWLDRGVSKKVIMTIPYGAGEISQAQGVLEKLLPQVTAWIERRVNEHPTWKADLADFGRQVQTQWERSSGHAVPRRLLAAAYKGLEQARRQEAPWLTEASTLHRWTGEAYQWRIARRRAKRSEAPPEPTEPYLCWAGAYGLAAALAWWTTQSLRAALKEAYPKAGGFGRWLKQVARGVSGDSQRKPDPEKGRHPTWGLPLVWRTPLGFHVAQPGFAEGKTSRTGQGSGGKLTLHFTQMLELVDPETQAQGLLPNLIHSLDATHLLMTVEQAAGEGIGRLGAIHDCLLCHPNEAQKVGEILRATFANLYRLKGGHPTVLRDWYEWMALLAEVARLKNVRDLKSALKWPGGRSEKTLDEPARKQLEKIRQRDADHRRMVEALLDYAMNADWETQRQQLRDKWEKERNESLAKAKPTGSLDWALELLEKDPHRFRRPQAQMPDLPGYGGLNIDQVRESPYFFH